MAEDDREFLTFEQAESMLPDGDLIHTYRGTGPFMIGANWAREEVLTFLRRHRPELSGPNAARSGHALCVIDDPERAPLFIATAREAPVPPARPEVEVRAALDRLLRIEAEIAGWQARRAVVREELSLLIATHYPDARAIVPGYGTVAIRAPGVARVWDSGALSELAQSLRETGHAEIAEELEACRRTQERAGGLAVKWETAGEEAGASS